MYNFKKFPGVTPPDPQHWLGGEGVKPPSGEILATGLTSADHSRHTHGLLRRLE